MYYQSIHMIIYLKSIPLILNYWRSNIQGIDFELKFLCDHNFFFKFDHSENRFLNIFLKRVYFNEI